MDHQKHEKLFHLRGKNPHPACVTYRGISTRKENYISETQPNVEILWEEYSDINKISEPSRH